MRLPLSDFSAFSSVRLYKIRFFLYCRLPSHDTASRIYYLLISQSHFCEAQMNVHMYIQFAPGTGNGLSKYIQNVPPDVLQNIKVYRRTMIGIASQQALTA